MPACGGGRLAERRAASAQVVRKVKMQTEEEVDRVKKQAVADKEFMEQTVTRVKEAAAVMTRRGARAPALPPNSAAVDAALTTRRGAQAPTFPAIHAAT